MIRLSASSAWAEGAPEPVHGASWSARPPGRPAFVTLWTSGADPLRDDLVRAQALRLTPDGDWESFSRTCQPARAAESPSESEPTGVRLARDYGLHASDLATGTPAASVLTELRSFLAGYALITTLREPFLAYWNWPERAHEPPVLDLAEIAALCWPGRLASEGERLAVQLLQREPAGGPRALGPEHLRAALGLLVARVLAQAEPVRAAVAHALEAVRRALEREDESRAVDVAFVAGLLEYPAVWRDPARALEAESYELRDGRLSSAAASFPTLSDALDAARPRWHSSGAEGKSILPTPRLPEEHTLDEHDRRHVDEIFQVHLPRLLTAGRMPGGSPQTDANYRLGQHGVASVIAEGFGRRELRLVHAPTGTGKTLAYLVPTALWAFRNNARVAVATFTRVLQEQAMQREAPIAIELLRRSTGIQGLRLSVLKGRENYLCWRALCLQRRERNDPADEVLAWTTLMLFALRDETGDLDGFAARMPLDGLDGERYRRTAERLLRSVRSESGCCTLGSDRETCGAHAAWRTAERAHVVITNHALALARRDFFQHLVFDECEHLHDVALSSFSSSIGLRELSGILERLHGPDDRRPLSRIQSLATDGSVALACSERCIAVVADVRAALTELTNRCRAFKAWRAERVRERQESDLHSLFREYVQGDGEALLDAHAWLCNALGGLCTELAQLQESLDGGLPGREAPRLRRALEILRVAQEEAREAVVAWIPRDGGGRSAFGRESFHDLEVTPRGEDVLVTRVLLPHEYLGRHYYPTLAGAVLLSATTWLRGGFESASAYLGVARAAEPAPEEEREPVPFQAFRAPEVFDYRRVLVAVPRDAPPVHDKLAHLDYTVRFLGYLAERTRGRLLALFTNAEDAAVVGTRLEPFFRTRRLPFWWQRMRGSSKEELGQLFRSHVDSVLLGLDAFWYGADFPGSTLEYLVIVRLPYGVPDRYHHAQCAALGAAEQRRMIYLPRALSKFRQGFGRLMRKETDRGCVFVLDRRALDPRHRAFLNELPVQTGWQVRAEAGTEADPKARLVVDDSGRCLDEALAHMGMKAEVRRRGLTSEFVGWRLGEA